MDTFGMFMVGLSADTAETMQGGEIMVPDLPARFRKGGQILATGNGGNHDVHTLQMKTAGECAIIGVCASLATLAMGMATGVAAEPTMRSTLSDVMRRS